MKRHHSQESSEPAESAEQNQISTLDLDYLRLTQALYPDNSNNFYCLTKKAIAATLKKTHPLLQCITCAEELTQNKDNFEKTNRILVLGPIAEDAIISLLDFSDFTDTGLILNDSQYANATSINNHVQAASCTTRILTEKSTHLIPACGYIVRECPSTLLQDDESLNKIDSFIALTSHTTADTLATLSQIIEHVFLLNLTPDQIKQLPGHIKNISITNILDAATIAAIPLSIFRIYVENADATRMKAIPGHITHIDLSVDTTPQAAAAIPQTNSEIDRTVHIHHATAGTVAQLPEHIKVVCINNSTPLESIAAIPATVTNLWTWNADATRMKAIPGHIIQIDLSLETTPGAAAAIPQANPGIDRIVHIHNATADAIAQLPKYIKTVYIDNETPLASIATIPSTITYVLPCNEEENSDDSKEESNEAANENNMYGSQLNPPNLLYPQSRLLPLPTGIGRSNPMLYPPSQPQPPLSSSSSITSKLPPETRDSIKINENLLPSFTKS